MCGSGYGRTASSVQCAMPRRVSSSRGSASHGEEHDLGEHADDSVARSGRARHAARGKAVRPQIACRESGRGSDPCAGVYNSIVSRCCCREVARSAPIKPASIRRWLRPGFIPTRVVGISIGAINAAIIAGNAPERRIDKLRAFWEESPLPPWELHADVFGLFERGEARTLANQVSAAMVAYVGTSGFFRPRITTPWFHPPGTIEATSYYDTQPLRTTLERFIDFDRLNSGKETRLSLR